MKKFSNLANKVNIEKFKQQKKMMKNINNLKEEINYSKKVNIILKLKLIKFFIILLGQQIRAS